MSKNTGYRQARSALSVVGLAIGDPHLERFSSNYFNNLLQDPLDLQLKAMERGCQIAHDQGIKNVFMLGDIIDHPNPKQDTIVRLINLFNKFHYLKFWVITGNHEVTARGRNGLMICEFLSSAQMLPNVNIFTEPKMVTIDGFPVYFMPWGYSEQPRGAYLGIGHHSVSGAFNDNGYPIKEEGEKITNKRAKWIMGHIHLRQSHDWGCYPGTPYQINFGESTSKYFVKFKAVLTDGKVDLKTRFIPSNPPFLLQTIDIKSQDQEIKKPPANTFYKVRLSPGVTLDSAFLTSRPWIIKVEILGKDNKVTEIVSAEDAPEDTFRITPTYGLAKYLVNKGMDREKAMAAVSFVKRIR